MTSDLTISVGSRVFTFLSIYSVTIRLFYLLAIKFYLFWPLTNMHHNYNVKVNNEFNCLFQNNNCLIEVNCDDNYHEIITDNNISYTL